MVHRVTLSFSTPGILKEIVFVLDTTSEIYNSIRYCTFSIITLVHDSIAILFVCLFGVYRPTRENFSLIRRRYHYRWRAANFLPMLSIHVHWAVRFFFSVPHILWHGTSVYDGHLRGPVTLTPIAERLAVELSLPVFYDLGLSRLGSDHPTFCLRGKRSNPLRHRCSMQYGNGNTKYIYLTSIRIVSKTFVLIQ